MQIYEFIDTNVLLHYAFFRDVDWAEVLDSPEVVVVLAPVVLGELDEHKWSGSRREKSRAKAVLKALDQLELSTVPARLRERVRIMAIADEPEDVVFRRQRLQGTVKDDRLLASLLHFRERVTCDGRVVLISADSGLRVKARSREIEVTRPDASLALADEPDETERQLVAAKAELAALQNAKPELRVIVDGATHSSFSVGLVRAYDPTTLKFKLEEWCATQPHVQGWPGRPPRSGGGSPAESIWGLAELGLESSALEHKKTVEHVFSAHEEFLMAWPEVVNSYRRTLRFDFVLENLGTGPAEDVDVVFSTDANGIWLNALPDLPQPPTMPRRRDWLGEPLGTPVVPSFGPEDFVHP